MRYFFKFLKISVPSVRTETEPKEPKPNYLGSKISQEPIGSLFHWNRISGGTERPNRRTERPGLGGRLEAVLGQDGNLPAGPLRGSEDACVPGTELQHYTPIGARSVREIFWI
jgi:hypothetical protein